MKTTLIIENGTYTLTIEKNGEMIHRKSFNLTSYGASEDGDKSFTALDDFEDGELIESLDDLMSPAYDVAKITTIF